ncbi:hyalin-like isoform X1 [Asterias rubens]|uniref:hyalin-like isoform X1 n=1 Tax=Asterias rubens TaxID=7604 RepID=UPI00145533D5|nr:hyalin-like isoform X1 [Asterias rubens]
MEGLDSIRFGFRVLLLIIGVLRLPPTAHCQVVPELYGCPDDIITGTEQGTTYAIVSWYPPIAQGGTSTTTVTQVTNYTPGDAFNIGDTTVVYTLNDITLQVTINCSFVIEVKDLELPVFTNCPTDFTRSKVSPDPELGVLVTWIEPIATDNAGQVTITSNYRPDQPFKDGIWRVQYSATDFSGNIGSCVFDITVYVGLLQECPESINQDTDIGKSYATVTWTEPLIRNFDPLVDVLDQNYESGDMFPVGTWVILYQLRDVNSQLEETCSFVVRVEDNERPVFLSCPSNIAAELSSSMEPTVVVTWQPPEVTDNSGSFSLASYSNSGDSFRIGDTVVRYTASDSYGNEAICEFNVKVTDVRDVEFTMCPDDIIKTLLIGQSRIFIAWQEPIISLEDRDITVTASHQPGDAFETGRTSVSYTAVDSLGNVGFCNFSIIVTGFPFNQFTRTEGFFLPGQDDLILLLDVEQCLRACIMETTFVCRSVDIDDQGKCRLSQSVDDDFLAVLASNAAFTYYKRLMGNSIALVGCPNDINRPADTGKASATISWLEPTVESAQGMSSLTVTHPSGSQFTLGKTRVVYTATDNMGFTATCSFLITIEDNESPLIRYCPESSIHLTQEKEDVRVSWIEPTATDNSGSVQLRSNYKPGDWFSLGSTKVTYVAQDEAGHQAECSFEIVVQEIPDSHYLSIILVLLNFAYTDALQDNTSKQFQALSSAIVNDLVRVFADDDTMLGSHIDKFGAEEGGVVAYTGIGFSIILSLEDQHNRLDTVLNAIQSGELTNVAEAQLENEDGSKEVLDECVTLPCPKDMTCKAEGRRCTATCQDNTGYCLNDGVCGIDAQNLVICYCRSPNIYGTRCQMTVSLTGKQLVFVILGIIWVFMLIFAITAYIIALIRRKHTKQMMELKSATNGKNQAVNLSIVTKNNNRNETDDSFSGQKKEGESSDSEFDITSNTEQPRNWNDTNHSSIYVDQRLYSNNTSTTPDSGTVIASFQGTDHSTELQIHDSNLTGTSTQLNLESTALADDAIPPDLTSSYDGTISNPVFECDEYNESASNEVRIAADGGGTQTPLGAKPPSLVSRSSHFASTNFGEEGNFIMLDDEDESLII